MVLKLLLKARVILISTPTLIFSISISSEQHNKECAYILVTNNILEHARK